MLQSNFNICVVAKILHFRPFNLKHFVTLSFCISRLLYHVKTVKNSARTKYVLHAEVKIFQHSATLLSDVVFLFLKLISPAIAT